uniref:Uncharacterized protein n=1 Tax=Arundo donax TaxID=35708 RepID=A0A0A9EGD3_ARUDO
MKQLGPWALGLHAIVSKRVQDLSPSSSGTPRLRFSEKFSAPEPEPGLNWLGNSR